MTTRKNTLNRLRKLQNEFAEAKRDATKIMPARIKQTRIQAKMTQEDVADAIMVSRTQYTNIELGNCNMTVANLILFCLTTGASADYILGLAD